MGKICHIGRGPSAPLSEASITKPPETILIAYRVHHLRGPMDPSLTAFVYWVRDAYRRRSHPLRPPAEALPTRIIALRALPIQGGHRAWRCPCRWLGHLVFFAP